MLYQKRPWVGAHVHVLHGDGGQLRDVSLDERARRVLVSALLRHVVHTHGVDTCRPRLHLWGEEEERRRGGRARRVRRVGDECARRGLSGSGFGVRVM
jgi:hypothetical protein